MGELDRRPDEAVSDWLLRLADFADELADTVPCEECWSIPCNRTDSGGPQDGLPLCSCYCHKRKQ